MSEKTATSAEELLRGLDAAAYAGTGAIAANAGRDAAALARAVDQEALGRSELPFWVPALLLAVGLTVTTAALAADTAASLFARGVSAYVRHDVPAARTAFADAVTLAPTSPDAWANYGTASWIAADTAAAVLGWRQALALEPDAADLRDRLDLARPVGPASPGWVPPVPRNAAVWLFAILWAGAWFCAWLARRSQPWVGRLPLPLASCALLVGLLAIELEERVSGARLAVVRHAGALVSDPAIGMDRGPAVATGEIVRVAGRRGAWTRVEASDDRDGWLPSSRLLPLADRRPPE